ncbi:MAG: hypothetical protein KBH45_01615 [Verrucomicrobia bacterium]|nr:hypothetical protein [Verrucomicrobiota bacterium]
MHTDSIAVSLARTDTPEVRGYGITGGQREDVLKLLKKLQASVFRARDSTRQVRGDDLRNFLGPDP